MSVAPMDTQAFRFANELQKFESSLVVPSSANPPEVEKFVLSWVRSSLAASEYGSPDLRFEISIRSMNYDAEVLFQDGSRLAIEVKSLRRKARMRHLYQELMTLELAANAESYFFIAIVVVPYNVHGEIREGFDRLFGLARGLVLVVPGPSLIDEKSPKDDAGLPEIERAEAGEELQSSASFAPEEGPSIEGAKPKEFPDPSSNDHDVRPEVLSDGPIHSADEDRLEFGRYARAIYALIDGPRTKTPLTIAIHAPWGSGKTSLARLIEEQAYNTAFGGTKPHKVFWFNAWLHDEGNSVPASFVSALARYCQAQRNFLWRFLSPLSSDLLSVHERRKRRYNFTVFSFSFFLLTLLLLPQDVLLDWSSPVLGDLKGNARAAFFAKGGLLAVLAFAIPFAYSTLTKFLTEIGAAMGAFVLDPKLEAQTASLQKLREELSALVRRAVPIGSRLIVIIDDVERCRPPGCIDLLEAVNQLFEEQDLPIVFLILADMTALSAATKVKYETLSKHYTPTAAAQVGSPARDNFGRVYLEKLIALQFDIPLSSHAKLVAWTSELRDTPRARPIVENDEFSTIEWIWRCALDPKLSTWTFLGRATSRPHKALSTKPSLFLRVVEFVVGTRAFFFPTGRHYLFLLFRFLARNNLRIPVRIDGADKRSVAPSADTLKAATLTSGVQDDLKALEEMAKRVEQNLKAHLERRNAEEQAQDKSAKFGAARDVALKFVRTRPRSMKRMINRLRLAVYLTQGEQIEAANIGKWTALQENWPELASAISSHDSPNEVMRTLEGQDETESQKMVESLAPGLSLSERLNKFLAAEPKLAPHIADLVRLSAA